MESVHHRHLFSQSAWSDSNRRSRAPKARGVPLSYTLPNVITFAREGVEPSLPLYQNGVLNR